MGHISNPQESHMHPLHLGEVLGWKPLFSLSWPHILEFGSQLRATQPDNCTVWVLLDRANELVVVGPVEAPAPSLFHFPPVQKLFASAFGRARNQETLGRPVGKLPHVASHYPECPAGSAGPLSSVLAGPERFPARVAGYVKLSLFIFEAKGSLSPQVQVTSVDSCRG